MNITKTFFILLAIAFNIVSMDTLITSPSSNAKTLQTYENCIQEYVQNTPTTVSSDRKVWIDSALSYINTQDSILEIGSALGRDANYIESQGYKVKRTDATKNFIKLLQQHGYEATLLNILTDNLGGPYDMVFASAVLIHLNPEEFKKCLSKMYNSLQHEGILAFSVKQGTGEEWSEREIGGPRYFCYWLPNDLQELLLKNKFKIIDIKLNNQWIFVITKKI
ncbi:methyltransferase domain-containing protein [Candidatus Dependentiae bacterium]|nr:methyltransferase domain-containing protein [Candidatus Dependentiae bacterium]